MELMGGNSVFIGTALGGAGGATGDSHGVDGGSGGAAGSSNSANAYDPGEATQGDSGGMTGYGNDGGPSSTGLYRAAGGGGAGGAGGAGHTTTSSNGGAGIQNVYRSGSNQWYAAGGAGHTHDALSPVFTDRKNGIGGMGGRGYNQTVVSGNWDALDGTGAGGSGADQRWTGYSRAGDGSYGIVVIRYAV